MGRTDRGASDVEGLLGITGRHVQPVTEDEYRIVVEMSRRAPPAKRAASGKKRKPPKKAAKRSTKKPARRKR